MKLSTLSAAVAGVILGAVGVSYFQNHQTRINNVVDSTSVTAADIPTLALGASAKGELTSQSFLNLVNGVRSQAYTLPSTTDQIILLNVEGPLNAQISVLKDNNLLTQSACEECQEKDRKLSVGFKAKPDTNYTVVVSGLNAQSYGPFELSNSILKSHAGEIITGETEFVDWGMGKPRRYRLNIEKDGLYQIDMRSHQSRMDAYLQVKDRRNREIASDDDSGGGTDAQIQAYLKAGEYILETTSALGEDNFQGGYDVQIQTMALPSDITLQDKGEITLDGVQRHGLLEQARASYTLTVEKPTIVAIEVTGLNSTPELRLKNPNSSSNARGGNKIRTELAPGTHTIEIIRPNNSISFFSLTAQELPPGSPYSGGELQLGTTHEAEMLVGMGRNIYQFTIEQEGDYKILMEAPDFDTYIELYDKNGLIAEDDDSGGDLNSLLEVHLVPGSYELHAITLNSQQYKDMEYSLGVYPE
ncbi:hypothetical protein [Alcaligenes endophyticus]|uniref:Peptidase C-terminal archaeal/bacterial domain-containing protein n=1 Tax=Alcaligenes endophyticus TaxID=1929088 RepID=A0ABT8EKL6_9BURK|nr:hypothetical protein [Alcaligenes endophyticus]MCX5590788.1 hypothetical protein [Alcaligenes endophyticus]MDN4121849.1 hypothetical protein [Alcaligenes endophyticus]